MRVKNLIKRGHCQQKVASFNPINLMGWDLFEKKIMVVILLYFNKEKGFGIVGRQAAVAILLMSINVKRLIKTLALQA